MHEPPYITSAMLQNYRSIAWVRVDLQSLTFLVGPNGSGKSNFLDGIRFVSESLQTSLDHALRERGSIKEVRRRSGGHPNHFAIRLDFHLPGGELGHYAFRVGAKPSGGFEVQNEECVVSNPDEKLGEASFHIERGHIVSCTANVAPPAVPDRLFLVAAAGLPEFRSVYDGLSKMVFYNLNPKEIAAMQKPDAGDLLLRDGRNCASVFSKLSKQTQERVSEYLAGIVTGVSEVEARLIGSQETLEFRQHIKGAKHPWRFLAASMSDGTLRAFGILLALFQAADRNGRAPLLVGLEEPEMALHPAAAGVLLGCLREASAWTQVLVTSHSPDLLDDAAIEVESLLAVESEDGTTRIGHLDPAGRSTLRDRLFTPGELLRSNQLAPDPGPPKDIGDERQLRLFELGA
jgi:predicted ATPase